MTEAKPTTSTDARPKIEVVEKAPKKGLKVEIITEKPPFFSAPRRFAQTMMRAEARLVAVAGGALALGAMLGFGAASRDQGSATAIASLATAIESGRSDTAKLAASLAKLDQNVGELRTVADSARKESGGKSLNEKIAQLDRSLTAKLASLNEKIEQAEKSTPPAIAALPRAPPRGPSRRRPAASRSRATRRRPNRRSWTRSRPRRSPTPSRRSRRRLLRAPRSRPCSSNMPCATCSTARRSSRIAVGGCFR